MARLREKDKRFNGQQAINLEPGDIVKDNRGGEALVIAVRYNNNIYGKNGKGRQSATCVHGAREVDLYREVRRYIQRVDTQGHNGNPDLTGISVSTRFSSCYTFVRKAPKDWMQSITNHEILTNRFSELMEDD